MHPAYEIQKIICSLLSQDSQLGQMTGGRIYSRPPHHVRLPYIAIDSLETRNQSGDAADSYAHELTLSVYSQTVGRHEITDISWRLISVLLEANMESTSHNFINFDFIHEILRPDIREGVTRSECVFRVMSETTAS